MKVKSDEEVSFAAVFSSSSTTPTGTIDWAINGKDELGDEKQCEPTSGGVASGNRCRNHFTQKIYRFNPQEGSDVSLSAKLRKDGEVLAETPSVTLDVVEDCSGAVVGGEGYQNSDKRYVYHNSGGNEDYTVKGCSYTDRIEYPSSFPNDPTVFTCDLTPLGWNIQVLEGSNLDKEKARFYCSENVGRSDQGHLNLPIVQYYVPEKNVPSVQEEASQEDTEEFINDQSDGWKYKGGLVRHQTLHEAEKKWGDEELVVVSESNIPHDKIGGTYYATLHNNDAYSEAGNFRNLDSAKITQGDYVEDQWQDYWTFANTGAPDESTVETGTGYFARNAGVFNGGFAPRCLNNLKFGFQTRWRCTGEPDFLQQVFMPDMERGSIENVVVGFHIMPYFFQDTTPNLNKRPFFQGMPGSPLYGTNPDSDNKVQEVEAVCWSGGKSSGYALRPDSRFAAEISAENGPLVLAQNEQNNPVPIWGTLDTSVDQDTFTCKWAFRSVGDDTFVNAGTTERVRSVVEDSEDYDKISKWAAEKRGYTHGKYDVSKVYNKSMNKKFFKKVSKEWAGDYEFNRVNLCDLDADELVPPNAICN